MTNLQRKLKLISLTGVCLSLNLPFALSQEHIVHKPEQKWLQLAEEQYRQGHFQLSVQSADRYLAGTSGTATGRTHTDRERARYFKTLALPEEGRYVNEPAVTNEQGVLFLPPPTEKMSRLAKVLGISIAVASVALLIYQQSRARKASLNGVGKHLSVQY